MPPCDPEVYIPITDPEVPAERTLAGVPARDAAGDVIMCGEVGVGLSAGLRSLGSGSGDAGTMKVSRDSATISCGYRELSEPIFVGGNIFISEDLGSYPKNQYINSSEIVMNLDNASMFTITVTRLDREYVFLLKSIYHRTSADGSRYCVGFVRRTSFGDLYYFIDGTTADALSELPEGRNLEIDEVPNYGRFIFENSPVRGKPATDSLRTIYLMIHNSSSSSGEIPIVFEEFFDFSAVGAGSEVANQFVFPKNIGFSVLKSEDAFQIEANSFNLYEIKINNPTMYVADPDFDIECIPNYNDVIHSRFSSKLIVTKIS